MELLTMINGDKTPKFEKRGKRSGSDVKLGELIESGKDLGSGVIIAAEKISGEELKDHKKLRDKIKAKEDECIAKVERERSEEEGLPKWSF